LDSIHSPEALIREAGALVFDLDGTLYDAGGFAWRLTLSRPGEAYLVLAERRARKALSGRDYGTPEAYYKAFFSQMSRLSGRRADKLSSWYFETYMPRFCGILKRHYHPRPGAGELFKDLRKASFPFAVYSDYPLTARRLAALDLDPAGGRLYGPEQFGAQKPAVRPFLSIAQDLGCPPERTLLIGDRDDTDGAGAEAAGMGYIRIAKDGKKGASPYPSLAWETCAALIRERLADRKSKETAALVRRVTFR
jgi:FMN phosphatase YigB (HAD superfamily)